MRVFRQKANKSSTEKTLKWRVVTFDLISEKKLRHGRKESLEPIFKTQNDPIVRELMLVG